ncbi:hypothetical protein B0H13DRAFT_2343745 [Mycena leptocephala]|nr:hypothetical protein B0H13DRAFT_2343745 [Mycena leptocephala]
MPTPTEHDCPQTSFLSERDSALEGEQGGDEWYGRGFTALGFARCRELLAPLSLLHWILTPTEFLPPQELGAAGPYSLLPSLYLCPLGGPLLLSLLLLSFPYPRLFLSPPSSSIMR